MSNISTADVSKAEGFARYLPASFRDTWGVRLWAWAKIPLLAYTRPTVVELTNQRIVVKLPLRRRTRNHLGSMYFGALCVGADTAGGLMAFRLIQKSGKRISLIFKDFHAEFLKRPEGGDVYFTCTDGDVVRDLVERVISTGERQNATVRVTATVPAVAPDEPVAQFVLTLSLKMK